MAIPACSSCNALLHARLRLRISLLASLRSRPQVRHKSKKVYPEPDLAYHWDTIAPTYSQLKSATAFFQTHSPRKLWTATEWRGQNNNSQPDSSPANNALGAQLIPEVVFLGRSNVGKSSLLNALLLDPLLNRVGQHPGKTTTMHAWGLSASNPVTGGAGPGGEMDVRLAVLDMPGYGYGSRGEWGHEIVTYLSNRRQLRRAFVLIDALHGIKDADETMVKMLRSKGISYQVVISKADRLLNSSKKGGNARLQSFFEHVRKELVEMKEYKGLAGLGEILAVGALGDGKNNKKVKKGDMLGLDQVRWAILAATGLEEWATRRTTDKEKMTANISPNKTTELNTRTETPSLWRRTLAHSDSPPTNSTSSEPSPHDPDQKTNNGPSISFLTRPDRRFNTPTPTTPSSPSSRTHNPVGGLAELEALSSSTSSRNRNRTHQSPQRGGSSSTKTPQSNPNPDSNPTDKPKRVRMSANLASRLALKREKKELKEMKAIREAGRLMGESGSGGVGVRGRGGWMGETSGVKGTGRVGGKAKGKGQGRPD